MLYIAKNIKALRADKKLSQALLASQLGIVPGTISNYENEVSTPDFETLEKLTKILGVSAHDLLYEDLSKRILETKTPKNVINENDNINDNKFDNKPKLQKTLSNDEGNFKTKSTTLVNNENVNQNVNPNVNFPKLQKKLTNDDADFKTKTPKNVVNENDHINDHNFDHKRKLQKTWSNDDADTLEIDTSAEMPLVTLAKAADLVAIPVVDVEAAAGTGAPNTDYFDTSEVMRLPASMLPGARGKRLCIKVAGVSMEPTLLDGSRVVIRLLQSSEYAQLPSNHICVVTDRSGDTYIKRVKNRLRSKGVLTLTSDNHNKLKYRPFDVDETEIHNIWIAELFIADDVMNCADYEMAEIREDLAELSAEVSKIAAKIESR